MSRYTVPAQGGPMVREFSNRAEAEKYAKLMRKDGWPAVVTDRSAADAKTYIGKLASFGWRTDAASGQIEAVDAASALEQLIAQDEWAELDSRREARDIADGAFLSICDADGLSVLTRGQMP